MKRYYVSGKHTSLIVCTNQGLQGVIKALEAEGMPVKNFDVIREATLDEFKDSFQDKWPRFAP